MTTRMKKRFNRNPKDKTIFFLVLFSSLSIIGMSIGFSALNTELSISGDAYVRVDEEIRITDLKMLEAINGAYETYNSKYSKDTNSMFVTLPNNNSTMTYQVTIVNKSSLNYKLKDILEESNTNSNISYEIIHISMNDRIESNSTITFQIKVTSRLDNQKTAIVLKYLFEIADNCQYNIGHEFAFDYTGEEQNFVVPCDGTYKLETWGAQGGNISNSCIGGYGAYARGSMKLETNEKLYVNVGGQGSTVLINPTIVRSLGGYNGGGYGLTDHAYNTSGGGGATHISKNSGILSSLSTENNNLSLLIASAGGGGAYSNNIGAVNGGCGGGIKGCNGISHPEYTRFGTATGATQISGGTTIMIGDSFIETSGFGKGADAPDNSGSGGGGGYYGGGAHVGGAGAGGSSYIGNSLLTTKEMYCYNCEESSEINTKTIRTTNASVDAISNYAKKGNGYAKITYLGK
ncbi:MAG: hypothetical protein HFH86_01130 [Bacilli bacterium]|jgi:hypothetical protein|nr:hypothetical protein [Bacilli bacterium]